MGSWAGPAWAAGVLFAAGLGCASEVSDEPVWQETSTQLNYEARGSFGGVICTASVPRADLSGSELEALAAMRRVEGKGNGACDPFTYRITISDENAEPFKVTAVTPDCGFGEVIPYGQFDPIAKQLGCSHKP